MQVKKTKISAVGKTLSDILIDKNISFPETSCKSCTKLKEMASSLFKKAVYELKNENPIDAIGFLQAVLIYEPNNIKAMINLGVTYAELGFKEKAIQTIENVLQIDPDNTTAKTNLEILKEGPCPI
ncbi:MAG: hypothetical protein HQK78_11840 [Desulfobacterales bacterium]|nr:hypothetical protein [Desulfobacterales bacterium]